MSPIQVTKKDDGDFAVFYNFPALEGVEVKSPKVYIPISDEFLPAIAQISLLWGGFENSFRDLLLCLMNFNGTMNRKVLYHSFDSKVNRMLEEMRCFETQPLIHGHLKNVIDDAIKVQSNRNLILHGEISAVMQVRHNEGDEYPTVTIELEAAGRQKKQDIIKRYTLADIAQLAADLSHVSGRIGEFAPPIFPHIPELAPLDRAWLQELLMTNYPQKAVPLQRFPLR